MSREALSFVSLVLVLWPTAAYGYIDPGSGLLLVQGLISAVIGGIFIARRAIVNGLARVALALGFRHEAQTSTPKAPTAPLDPPSNSSTH